MTIFAIMWELFNIMSPKRVHRFVKGLKEAKNKSADEWSSSQKSVALLMVLYIFWTFVGFFSFQWPLFLFLFLVGLIPKKWVWFRWVESLITFILLVFIILNAYHFQIDIWAFVQGFF